jgi:hypothetical protein
MNCLNYVHHQRKQSPNGPNFVQLSQYPAAGLPGGVISYKNPNLGTNIFEGLGMEKVGIFCGHLEYFSAIWYIRGLLAYFVVIWYFSLFGILYKEESGNPVQQHLQNITRSDAA